MRLKEFCNFCSYLNKLILYFDICLIYLKYFLVYFIILFYVINLYWLYIFPKVS